jgi:hypothetical protein
LPSSRCSSRTWCCKARYFGGGHHFLAGPDRRQRSLRIQPTPGEHLVRRDPALPSHQRHRHPRRVEPAPAKAGVSCTIAPSPPPTSARRRCTDVITSTRSIFPVIDTVILLVLNHGVDSVRSFRGPLQRV